MCHLFEDSTVCSYNTCVTIIIVSAGELSLMFGRDPTDNCPQILQCRESCDPFEANKIVALHDETFVAQIGPSALDRGYTGITGMVHSCQLSQSSSGKL